MRALNIFTALAIASASSVAFAEPVPENYDRSDRNVYDSDRYVRWEASRYRHERWVPLTRFSDADNGRQIIDVDARGGRLDKLRVESDRGTPLIQRVVVEYLNGKREVIRVDSTLSRGHGQVIDLRGDRRVSRILVLTDPRFDGLFSIYGT